jgi:hypothetical protein
VPSRALGNVFLLRRRPGGFPSRLIEAAKRDGAALEACTDHFLTHAGTTLNHVGPALGVRPQSNYRGGARLAAYSMLLGVALGSDLRK